MKITIAMLIVFLAGYYAPIVLTRAMLYFFDRKILSRMVPGKIDPKKLCKGPHSWLVARALTQDGLGETQVCRMCGLVSGSDRMASLEVVDTIEENNRTRKIEAKLVDEFLAKEDKEIGAYFAEELNSGLSFEKLTRIHAAGMTFTKRYAEYKVSAIGNAEKEFNKHDS